MIHDIPHCNHPIPDGDPSFSGRTTLWMIENWKVVDLFVYIKKMCSGISQRNIIEICGENRICDGLK